MVTRKTLKLKIIIKDKIRYDNKYNNNKLNFSDNNSYLIHVTQLCNTLNIMVNLRFISIVK